MFTRKPQPAEVSIEGVIPGAPAGETAILRSRIHSLTTEFVTRHRVGAFELRVGNRITTPVPAPAAAAPAGPAAAEPVERPGGAEFTAIEPSYRMDQLALPARTSDRLLDCIAFVEVAPVVFDSWGLRDVEPHPSIAVNFRGPPGTGKTMAAHAAAHHLRRKIILSRLSELESKFHGQGPKNLVELFASARKQDAVLFIDEAESLLSRRFAQPEQAAESAINSMRTELLMALDAYDGLVIFASNLPHSYDTAVESRLLHVDFELPDRDSRVHIWRSHLPPRLPRTPDVTAEALAEFDGVSGRDIKLTVIAAAVSAARRGLPYLTLDLLVGKLEEQRKEKENPPVRAEADPDLKKRIVRAMNGRTGPEPADAPPADAIIDG
ncbi:ATP-binding protein [Actinoplanes philippinensis]|uniref:ATP-binding protein n=1 Tax=Actinoplanes philippinensis TaxID=35752 RepID=UPI00340E3653